MSKLLDNLEEIEMQKASFIIPKNLKKDVKALGVTGILDGGIDTSDATATSKDIKEGKTAYVNDKKITGTLQQADTDWALNGITDEPISVELKTGNPDYIQMKFKRSGTDIVVGGSSNVTANMSQETMAVVSNITPDKIKSGEVILGIAGNYIGLDTSDATATADDILKNATAYVNGTKVVGNVADYRDGTITPSDADIEWVGDPQVDRISFTEKYGGYNVCFIGPNTTLGAYTPVSKLANFINLTPDILKKDENRLGITGTYEGSGISNFANNLDELQQLVNTYSDYYITMNNINNLSNAFSNQRNLTVVPNFDTSNVTSMSNMFSYCDNLRYVPNFDTSNVTNMSNMFTECINLKNYPNFNTENVRDFSCMFFNSKMVSAPNFIINNAWKTSYMFQACYNLVNVPNYNMHNVESMSGMFSSCSSLIEVPNFNTHNAVIVSAMFDYCSNLINAPNLDTSNVNWSMEYMFRGCYNLVSVPMYNMSKVKEITGMFYHCNNLSNESYANIANMLPLAQNLTNQYISNIGLNLNRFTNIQKNILINKGYKDFGSSNSYSEYYDIYYT